MTFSDKQNHPSLFHSYLLLIDLWNIIDELDPQDDFKGFAIQTHDK